MNCYKDLNIVSDNVNYCSIATEEDKEENIVPFITDITQSGSIVYKISNDPETFKDYTVPVAYMGGVKTMEFLPLADSWCVNPLQVQIGSLWYNACYKLLLHFMPLNQQISAYTKATTASTDKSQTVFFIWDGTSMAKSFIEKLKKDGKVHAEFSSRWATFQAAEINTIKSSVMALINAGISRDKIYVFDLPDLRELVDLGVKVSGVDALNQLISSRRNFNQHLFTELTASSDEKYNLAKDHVIKIDDLHSHLKGYGNYITDHLDSSDFEYYDNKNYTTAMGKVIASKVDSLLSN